MVLGGLVLSQFPKTVFALAEDPGKKLKKNKGLIFVFQGDSITHGGRGMNPKDLNHVMGHGFAATVSARLAADFPEKHLSFYNRGLIGHKITDLQARWQTDTLDLKPDVLTILVGINDSDSYRTNPKNGVSVETYEKTYRELLNQVKHQNPDVLFVLGEPFTLPYDINNPRFSDVIKRQEAVKRIAKDYNAIFLSFQTMFNTALQKAPESYWIWDHIHPTIAGHELMAREWIKQMVKKINL